MGTKGLSSSHSLSNSPYLEDSSFARTWVPFILYLFSPLLGVLLDLMYFFNKNKKRGERKKREGGL
jgi:purine-cytosine permease-like protein